MTTSDPSPPDPPRLTASAPSPDTIRLRRAGAADASAVRALTRSAYAKWVERIGREPLPMRADHAAAIRDHRVDLLEIDGRLAALIETIPHPDHLLVENVAVDPSCQRLGLGRRLMAHADSLAAALGLAELRLYTNRAFEGNVRLYQGLGYRTDREQTLDDGTVVVFMSKFTSKRPG